MSRDNDERRRLPRTRWTRSSQLLLDTREDTRWCQFLSTVTSSFAFHARHVVDVRLNLQVMRPEARRVVAEVRNVSAVKYLLDLVRRTIGE
jgi:hypothetical protein